MMLITISYLKRTYKMRLIIRHTSIVVYDVEFYYGQGILTAYPVESFIPPLLYIVMELEMYIWYRSECIKGNPLRNMNIAKYIAF